MNKAAKIVIVVVILLVLAFVGYRYIPRSQTSNTNDQATITDTSDWKPVADPAGYSVLQPTGFSAKTDSDGKVVELANTDIVKDDQYAFVAVEVRDNPNKLSLQAWYDDRIQAGDLPAPATSTQVERDRTLGGKPVIVITPANFGSSTYLFAEGDKIIALRELLSEPYMDGIIKNFKLD